MGNAVFLVNLVFNKAILKLFLDSRSANVQKLLFINIKCSELHSEIPCKDSSPDGKM